MQRRYERNMCADLVKVRWKDEGGKRREEFATLEDISPSGACVQLDEPIPAETLLSLHHAHGRLEGRVRYCVFQGTGHFIGIEFAEGSRWSPRHYKPSHLLRFWLRPVRKSG